MKNERAVVTVIGKDQVGILANVSAGCADAGANVIEVTQSVLDGYFCMIMVIDISKLTTDLDMLKQNIEKRVPSMVVHVMHQNIFDSMHRI
ncbi:MAG: ACT domain-containing protein [Christensenellales bacterium]